MSRRCAEPVEVRLGNDAPAQFLWRDRLYLVRGVHAHWVEAGRWWRSPAASAVLTGADVAAAPVDDLVLAPIPSAPKWGQRAWGEPAPDVCGSVAPSGIDDGEREFWRVEAGTGRTAPTGVFDLCFDWGAATWTIARVLD